MLHFKLDTFSKIGSIIIELISTILIIISLILLIVQGFDNNKFKDNKNREIITEKFLYNIFSQEIYSNLNTKIFVNHQFDGYDNDYNYLNAGIMDNSYFDCRDVKDGELNEDICQNKIINNKICCKAECCSRNNGGKVFCNDYNFQANSPNINNHKILSYDREEYYDDPRRRFCTYYNKYDSNINRFNNQKDIRIAYVNYTYEDLILNRVPYACINYTKCRENYIDCGIIDTMNRHLYISNGELCPINNIKFESNIIKIESIYDDRVNYNHIILKNILSEITPISHEKSYFDKECNYIYDDKSILNEDITIKDINKLLMKRKDLYSRISSFQLSLRGYEVSSGINNNAKFNWYTTNYIGFKTVKDYLRFKKYFSESDSYSHDNNLYKIGKKIYPCIKHIIVCFPLLIIFLLYIIILFLSFTEKVRIGRKKLKILFIGRFVLLICIFILEIIFYGLFTNKFEEIYIDMDDNFKEILDLYNKRRFQLLYLLSIIFLSLSFISIIIFFYFNCESSNSNNPIINIEGSYNNIKNEENDNIHRDSRNIEQNHKEVSDSSRNIIDRNKSKNNDNDNDQNKNEGKENIIPFENNFDNKNYNKINEKRTINEININDNLNDNLISNKNIIQNNFNININGEENNIESKKNIIIYNEKNNEDKKNDLIKDNFEINNNINNKKEYEKLGINKKDNKNNKTTLDSDNTDLLNKYNKSKNKKKEDSNINNISHKNNISHNNNNLFDEET